MQLIRFLVLSLLSIFVLFPTSGYSQRVVKVDLQEVFETEDSRGKVVTCAFVEARSAWLPGKLLKNTFFRLEQRPKSRKARLLFMERLELCKQGPPDDEDTPDGDDDDSDTPGQSPDGRGEASRLATIDRVQPGIAAPAELVLLAEAQVARACLAAWEASRLAGVSRGTGTLTQVSQTPLIYDYSAIPNDRLRVVQLDGTVFEYFFQLIEGNFSVDAMTFLSQNYRLKLRAVVVDSSDLLIESNQGTLTGTGRVVGTFRYNGSGLSGDISQTGTYNGESDFDGFSRQDTLRFNGIVRGDNLLVNVSETIYKESIGGRRLYAWQTFGSVRRSMNSSWVRDGLTFSLNEAVIRSYYQNGGIAQISNPTRWSAQGILLVNGALAGLINMATEPSRVVAAIPVANGSVEVQAWHR
jgi:hypothetical protein